MEAELAAAPIFVGGINRSGTTLLARMIGSHRSVAVPPTELLFFGRGWHRPLAGRADFERRLDEILASPRARAWELDGDELLSRSRSVEPTPRSLLALVLDAYRRRTGRPRVGEKSVLNERRLGLLGRWFPDFLLVQMVRDPVSTFVSGHNRRYGIVHALDRRAMVRPWERRAIASVCGPLAEAFGYDLAAPVAAPYQLVFFGALGLTRGRRAVLARRRPAA